jgi:hypothetical protein
MTLTCAAFGAAELAEWQNVPIACHTATACRLHEAEFSRFPRIDDIVGTPLQPLFTRMAGFGQQVMKPAHADAALVPHSVVIFMRGEHAAHSCIASAINRVGGYNQTNFFTSAGVAHGYSEHDTADLVWNTQRTQVATSVVNGPTTQASNYGMLFQVPENVARAILREAVQK